MSNTVTIEANTLETIVLNKDAGPAAIGRALSAIHEFLDDVLIDALYSRELRNGTQSAVILSNTVATLGQAAQVLGAESNLAVPQMVPPQGQMGPRRM